MDVFRFGAAGVGLGDLALQVEHLGGLGFRLGDPGQAQDRSDVTAIEGAQSLHARGGVQIVFAVRHAEPALKQIGRVAVRVLEVLGDPEPEHMLGVELGVVQRIDVGEQGLTQRLGQHGAVGDGRHALQAPVERLHPFGLDRTLVEVGPVEITDDALVRTRRRLMLGGLLDQIPDLLGRALPQLTERSPVGLVRRDLGRVHPASVGIGIEVVARRHTPVDAGEVHAVMGTSGFDRGGGCARGHDGADGEREGDGAESGHNSF